MQAVALAGASVLYGTAHLACEGFLHLLAVAGFYATLMPVQNVSFQLPAGWL